MTREQAAPIVAAEAIRVRIPLRRPFETSAGSWAERETWVVRWRDATGLEAVGEACLDPAATRADRDRLAELVRRVVPTLAGRDVTAAATDPTGLLGPGGGAADVVHRALRAALEASLVGAGPGADPGAELSPVRTAVAVNATIATEDAVASLDTARSVVDAGYRTLKLKGGSEPSTAALVQRLAAIRSAVGADVALRLDVNGAWDPATARERLAALAGLGLAYVEDPITGHHPADLGRLRSESPVPLAVDEPVASGAAADALLGAGAADVLVVKPTRVGGPAEALAIASSAATAGVPVVISTLLETGIGLATACWVAARLPRLGEPDGEPAHGLATGALLEHDLLARPLSPVDGRLEVPTMPGLGVDVDEAALDRYAVERIPVGESWR